MTEFLHGDITREIIGAAFAVHRELGYGFLEKVEDRFINFEGWLCHEHETLSSAST